MKFLEWFEQRVSKLLEDQRNLHLNNKLTEDGKNRIDKLLLNGFKNDLKEYYEKLPPKQWVVENESEIRRLTLKYGNLRKAITEIAEAQYVESPKKVESFRTTAYRILDIKSV